MSENTPTPRFCDHEEHDKATAIYADGLCPICLRRELAAAREELAAQVQVSAKLASERACEMIRAEKAEAERDAAIERAEAHTIHIADLELRLAAANARAGTGGEGV